MDRKHELQVNWDRERDKWSGQQGASSQQHRGHATSSRQPWVWAAWSWGQGWDADGWQAAGKRGGEDSGDGRGDKRSRTWL
eukprot:1062409-Pyramimonas_sp.AAC.1